MTNKEAIEQLKWVKKRICDITYSPESFEAINLAIKALENQDLTKNNRGANQGVEERTCNNCKWSRKEDFYACYADYYTQHRCVDHSEWVRKEADNDNRNT